MNKEIEKLEKQIKKTVKKENLFNTLANKIQLIKCGITGVWALLVIATIFMPETYYYIFGAVGLVSGIDLIVESRTHYGENICDNICQKYSSEIRKLKKQKQSLEREFVSNADKEEIKKVQKELGIKTSFVIDKNPINKDLVEEEKEQ